VGTLSLRLNYLLSAAAEFNFQQQQFFGITKGFGSQTALKAAPARLFLKGNCLSQ